MKKPLLTAISRRHLIRLLGAGVAAGAVSPLAGCNGSGDSSATEPSDDQLDNNGFDEITNSTAGAAWASGGTAALSTAFPPADPFLQALGTVCNATASYTLGPCYFSADEYRQDISDGELGIPMIVVLKLVDASCQPVAGANIDIWHCDREGLYSGDSSASSNAGSFSPGFCTANVSRALQARWFRGVQTTDANGLVYFKSCFPGWYPGRTTHIHFKIVRGGVQSLVSQFCFEDTLSNEIYLNHPEYTGQAKDTLNANDNVFGSDYNDYAFYIRKNEDNSMTAYKTIQIV